MSSDERSPKDTPKEKTEGRSPNKDITPVLRGWDYEPGTINVRKVSGLDGAPKLQMRQDLGLLQMEMTGRPDGRRPHGYESLLEYFETQLADHLRRNGTEDGFHLGRTQCQSLRDEAMMYYWRYLSLFVLEDFNGVVRDTARNLRVLDMCGKFAVDEQDQLVLEQYRPYIIMMNTRAQASIESGERRYADALRTIDKGLAGIREFFERFSQEEASYADANEVRVLKRLAREIRKKLPVNPVERLERRLEKAVREERYEDAADLRDRITDMKARRSSKKEVR